MDLLSSQYSTSISWSSLGKLHVASLNSLSHYRSYFLMNIVVAVIITSYSETKASQEQGKKGEDSEHISTEVSLSDSESEFNNTIQFQKDESSSPRLPKKEGDSRSIVVKGNNSKILHEIDLSSSREADKSKQIDFVVKKVDPNEETKLAGALFYHTPGAPELGNTPPKRVHNDAYLMPALPSRTLQKQNNDSLPQIDRAKNITPILDLEDVIKSEGQG